MRVVEKMLKSARTLFFCLGHANVHNEPKIETSTILGRFEAI